VYKNDPTNYKITNLRQLCEDTWRFNVSVYTSFGWIYIKGFRIRSNRLMSPSFNFSGSWPTSIVNLPRDLRDAIRKRVQKKIRKVIDDTNDRDSAEFSHSLSSSKDGGT
jgi:hypothetical protein